MKKRIPLEEMLPAPKQRRQLTVEQITRIQRIYSIVGSFLGDSIDEWIKGFTYDLRPEEEIKCWERISFVFIEYTNRYTLTFSQKRIILLRLINITMGNEPQDDLSKALICFWEKIRKDIQLKQEFIGLEKKDNFQAQEEINFVKLAFAYQKYIKSRSLSLEEKDSIIVQLVCLMEGEKPKDPRSKELFQLLVQDNKCNLNKEVFEPGNISDTREQVVSLVVRRKGQKKFRRDLFKAYKGRCSVTGCDIEQVLQAAHIIPYLGNETNHPTNGILLRSDIHLLFDNYFLSVDPQSYKVVISPKLSSTNYRELDNQKIQVPDQDAFKPNLIALEKHYQIFLQKCGDKETPYRKNEIY